MIMIQYLQEHPLSIHQIRVRVREDYGVGSGIGLGPWL